MATKMSLYINDGFEITLSKLPDGVKKAGYFEALVLLDLEKKHPVYTRHMGGPVPVVKPAPKGKPAPKAAPKAVKTVIEKASVRLERAKAKAKGVQPEPKRAPGRPRKVNA